MWIIAIPVVGVLVLSAFSFMSYKNAKKFYNNQSSTRDDLSQEMYDKVQWMVKNDMEEQDIMVNGHYTTQVTTVVKVESYYSYVLLLNQQRNRIKVISYAPNKKESVVVGSFPIREVEAIEIQDGFQTNFIFKDDQQKSVATIQVLGHEQASESEYQIKYFQEQEYNALRQCFGLSAYSYKEVLKDKGIL